MEWPWTAWLTLLWDVLGRGCRLVLGPHRALAGPASHRLPVTIRTETGQTLHLELDPSWDVGAVLSLIRTQLGQPADSPIRLILAGTRLAPDVRVMDCDLGVGTTLHALRVQQPSDRAGPPLSSTATDWAASDASEPEPTQPPSSAAAMPASERPQARFYVYCCSPCQSLKTGKLRVRCSACLDGAIVLHQEPASWEDVLQPHRIEGTCNFTDCDHHQCSSWAEFYFKCAGHSSSENTPPLPLVRSNLHDVPCLACLDVCDPVIVFECPDRHVSCVECFQTYARSRLNERQFQLHPDYGYTLPCPVGCDHSLVQVTRHFKLLGPVDYERYQRFATEEYVLQAGGVLCPQPDCGMGIMMEEPCRRVVCENGCGFVFCRQCLAGYHIGECISSTSGACPAPGGDDSSQASRAVEHPSAWRARWVDADPSALAIQLTTKPCPKCRTPTEWSGGCMHMICTKAACGFHWCWICQMEWTRDCMANHWFG
eukprot:snap_masked-scaffold269_size230758-processed-gene-1.8 protein:Tk07999 transcript:snap_masked-scaffold269_size230758-processed-gene-1.8-mRNA-1 annotation:"GA10370"